MLGEPSPDWAGAPIPCNDSPASLTTLGRCISRDCKMVDTGARGGQRSVTVGASTAWQSAPFGGSLLHTFQV